MLNKNAVYLVSFIIFIISIIIFKIKKAKMKSILNYSIYFVGAVIAISFLFFPMPIQKEVILDKAYLERPQTFEIFSELKNIIYLVPNSNELFNSLKAYFLFTVCPIVSLGILIGFLIKLKVRTNKTFVTICFITGILIQFLKFLVCTILHANYLSVTPDDLIYLIIGCIIGSFILYIVRKLIYNVAYESKLINELKKIILHKSNICNGI